VLCHIERPLKATQIKLIEEFSHNRITVNMGSSGVIAICFLCCLILASIIWMIAKQGTLFSILIVASFLAIFIGAGAVGACLVISFGIERISDALQAMRQNKIPSSTVIAGEVVSHYDDGEWTHLSSIHEQGKVLPQLPMKAENKEPLPSEAYVILDMHRQGIGSRQLLKRQCGLSIR
jgi:hypothetical protein